MGGEKCVGKIKRWRRIENADILEIGVYPPPYGGVSNHIKRLSEFLRVNKEQVLVLDESKVEKNCEYVINIRKLDLIRLAFLKNKIVHFHGTSFLRLILIFFLRFRNKVIVSFHNERFLEEIYAGNYFLSKLKKNLSNKVEYIVVDNEKCCKFASEIIFDFSKIKLIPEFIPPTNIPEISDESILDIRKKHKFIISSCAWKLEKYKGEDLYGLDILVESIERLIEKQRYDIGLVFLLPNTEKGEYYNSILKKISDKNLENNILLKTENLEEASSLWKISDIVVRATNTDGNSLMILEALSVNTPVIASNCVSRHESVVLFKNRSVDDLCEKICFVLDNMEECKNNIAMQDEIYAEKILTLYRD